MNICGEIMTKWRSGIAEWNRKKKIEHRWILGWIRLKDSNHFIAGVRKRINDNNKVFYSFFNEKFKNLQTSLNFIQHNQAQNIIGMQRILIEKNQQEFQDRRGRRVDSQHSCNRIEQVYLENLDQTYSPHTPCMRSLSVFERKSRVSFFHQVGRWII